MSTFWLIFWVKNDSKNGVFFDSFLVQKLDYFRVPFSGFFWNWNIRIIWSMTEEANKIRLLWSLTPKSWPIKINFQNQVEKKSTSGLYYIYKNIFFQIPLFTGFLLISLSNIWLFSENIDFEKNSLKNQPFSNFVLISGFFVKTEKNADTTPKFTQNREENHKTIG